MCVCVCVWLRGGGRGVPPFPPSGCGGQLPPSAGVRSWFFFLSLPPSGQLPRSVGPCVVFDLFPAVRACLR